MRHIFLFLIMLPFCVRAADKPGIAVTDFTTADSALSAMAATLTGVACTELTATGIYTVISSDDVRQLLGHKAGQQALTGAEGSALADTLGAALLLNGNLGRAGSTLILNLSLVDSRSAQVLARETREHTGDEGGLVKEVRNGLVALLRQAGVKKPSDHAGMISLKDEAAASGDKLKIAVMDLTAKQGVSPQAAASLTGLATGEIARMEKYDVINNDDIRVMLQHMANRQLLDCDDTRCLAVIGGALGVDYIFSGSIGMLGNLYVINLKVIDIERAAVLTRVTTEFRGDEGGLPDHLRKAIDKLFDEGRLFRQQLIRWSTLGAAVVTGATGSYFAWKGSDIYENDYMDYGTSGAAGVGHDNALRLEQDIRDMDMYRNISLAATGVLTGLTWHLFTRN